MKKTMYIFIFCSIIVIIGCMIVFRIIPQSNDYSIINDREESLDVSVYIRMNNNHEELILIFNDTEVQNVIVLVPELKLIALSEGGRKEFMKINFLSSLLQRSNRANNYMIINNLINNDVINFYSFSEKEIEFNTFGELKKLGKTIIVKKP